MSKKRALITGITGQDGSYLAEYLLSKGYEVLGMVRRTSTINFDRIRHFQNEVTIVQGDLLDQMSLLDILREYRPEEVYNLAAQSFVPTSWKQLVPRACWVSFARNRWPSTSRTVTRCSPQPNRRKASL